MGGAIHSGAYPTAEIRLGVKKGIGTKAVEQKLLEIDSVWDYEWDEDYNHLTIYYDSDDRNCKDKIMATKLFER